MRGFDELTHGKHCVWCLEESSAIESIWEARRGLWPWASQTGEVALRGPICEKQLVGRWGAGKGHITSPKGASVLGRLPSLFCELAFLVRACRLWYYNPVTLFLSPLKKLIWQHIRCWIDTEMHGNVCLTLWGKALDIGLGWKEVGKRCRENKPALA